MMVVRPWLLFPRPRPSFQPILCSILLPILLLSSFLGSLVCVNSASSMAARYFSLSLFGLGPSSSRPYFCRRSLARSRYPAPRKAALLPVWLLLPASPFSLRQDSKLLRCRSDFSLCLTKSGCVRVEREKTQFNIDLKLLLD